MRNLRLFINFASLINLSADPIMIELLENCVRIASLSGQERTVAEFLVGEMQARGFDQAFVDAAGNAVGIIGNGPRQLVMLGHMDTVGGDVPVRYEGEGATRKLYGRGSVDAKGPLCTFVLAAAAFADGGRSGADAVVSDATTGDGSSDRPSSSVAASAPLRLPPDWQLVVIGATEEEAATSKGAHYAATQYQPELCIIGEPSGSEGITLGYKGRLLIEMHVEQDSHHTALPGPSASEQAVNAWNHIANFAAQYNADKAKVFDQVQPSLRSIRSGDSGLQEWCDVLVGVRLPPEFGPEAMTKVVEDYRVQLEGNEQASGFRFHFAVRGPEKAIRSSRDSVLARAFVDAIRLEKARPPLRPAFKLKTGTADFNIVGPIWNCPIVAYGPGDSSLDHTPIEHVEVGEFERAVRVLTNALKILTRS